LGRRDVRHQRCEGTGRIVEQRAERPFRGADEGGVRIKAGEGEVEIPHSRIRRSNLIPDYSTPLEESQ